jgi:FkbH-like protein
MIKITFPELIKQNNLLKHKIEKEKSFEISILTNITINQIIPYVEFELRNKQINAFCKVGEYDNIVQDSKIYSKSKVILIFWEASNILEGIHYKINSFTDLELNDLVEKVKSEICFVLDNLVETPLIIFNEFTSLVFNYSYLNTNKFDLFCKTLNDYLFTETKKRRNLKTFNLEKVIAEIGINNSIDLRNFYNSKSLYTTEFYKFYVDKISNYILALNGKAKKALIFDCDNTLWNGIVGEDGFGNLKMSTQDYKGAVFQEIQFLAKTLLNEGVLLGISSKNNESDIEDVLINHESMILKSNDFVIKKIDWNSKTENLKKIAFELNIGLDSFVFIDDSDFEINSVRTILPEVLAIQVPKLLYEYPVEFKKASNLFINLSKTIEDSNRSSMYLDEQQRFNDKKKFDSIEEYLLSLNLEMRIKINNEELISRISQLTQKTNQFNLTTKRYSESEIKNYINTKNLVFSIDVKDRFGDLGTTGVCIVLINDKIATIDSLLLSCRILGRKIEFEFINQILHYLLKYGVGKIRANFVATFKNSQVSDFYENNGFKLVLSSEYEKKYELEIEDFKKNKINHIKVLYE